MYAAQILVLLLFIVQVAHRARIADNPTHENEFNVFNFLQHPDVLIRPGHHPALQTGGSRCFAALYRTGVGVAAYCVVPGTSTLRDVAHERHDYSAGNADHEGERNGHKFVGANQRA
jgi:hypothetical protein